MRKVLIFLIFVLLLALLYSCSEQKDTLEVSTHPSGWNDINSEKFHGKAVLETNSESCKSCHGENFKGGTSGISCISSGCHSIFPHPNGFAELSSPNFHGEVIKSQLDWELSRCQDCHGANYAGGSSGVSCLTCHTSNNGPEACNTCHGSMANIAPPQDLSNNVNREAIGVGAHQKHVADAVVTNNYNCTACHNAVMGFDDPNHIDETPHAGIQFNALATDSGELTTMWDRTNATCSEVYCHGGFQFPTAGDSVITGNSDPVVWTATDVNGDDCTFCHGLPPKGHFGQADYTTPQSCSQCHTSVVNTDGTIKDLNKHINGQKNVFDQ